MNLLFFLFCLIGSMIDWHIQMKLLEVLVITTVILIVFAADTRGEFKTKTERANLCYGNL